MASSKLKRISRVLHRDLGFFFTGVVIIYGVSGLAVNHVDHWNPDFVVERQDVYLELPPSRDLVTPTHVQQALAALETTGQMRSFDFPSDQRIKIYFDDGSIMADMETGVGQYETVRRRAVLHQFNFLHLHPAGWWRLFADIFAVSLVLIAISGLLILSGNNGFSRRGKWLAGSGILAPLLAIFLT